jgi:hypothetical protein
MVIRTWYKLCLSIASTQTRRTLHPVERRFRRQPNGHEAAVALLLKENIDPDSRDKDNRTPLSYAAKEA